MKRSFQILGVLGMACCFSFGLPSFAQNTSTKQAEELAQAQLNLALQAFEQGQYRSALPGLIKAVSDDPNNLHLLRIRAETYQYLGLFEEAEADLQVGLKREPQNTELLEGLGWLRIFQKRFAEAEKILEQALALDPESFWIQLNLGHALLLQHKDTLAFKRYCGLAHSGDGPMLGDALKKDFSKLTRFEIFHPRYFELIQKFESHCGLGLVLPEECLQQH
ncbi:hypothetical protein COW36_19040 [bacterium (Candidatus Blackallbacteria) CG17_big_fil_post_rev_8_21_14_2_50_48_46]|uniref:Uncharacterized protein n=1 Tax=bacterium (Candidatus Blackallbacteria) CG17_big_fil_post_rev_8_21_14_2_50_48_46 TaxID=2014261 RepID=A0A2M7G015_9BACT|nr:MAG: hypothetical protein COW64_25430 [bacterium (Candidatus Blackallbacteria) CG18_big_fil_WC_8_21_14_2_50_49_26]PIW15023.1 MAG: hypothetical protein COW36_19040 [bacterium (Candidatus Blackallbacteria) CG17_big_fil_post_rev_8_21_14_2_50_48_46]PIW47654.1 MAG: hypothetical protein COW20_12280 [bacterium (Candidatus Blackallbacteria) CG13_big_fil_rev_8_21_14_2_50_49_14]